MRKKVENWGLVSIQPRQGRYASPEAFRYGITGRVGGKHVELPITAHNDGHFLSEGTIYELGQPDPVYEQKFPNAKERLVAMFQ